MVVFVCVCRLPQVLPGTAPAPVLKLVRVVMGAIGRAHVKIDNDIEKIIIAVFREPVDSSENND